MSGLISRQSSSRNGTVQNVAIGAASAASAAFGVETWQVRLTATSACYYVVTEGGTGSTTVAATTSNGAYLAANVSPEYVSVTPGQKITVIQASAAGNLNIVELS